MNILPFDGLLMHSVSGSLLFLFSLHFLPCASQFPHIDFDHFIENLPFRSDILYGSVRLYILRQEDRLTSSRSAEDIIA